VKVLLAKIGILLAMVPGTAIAASDAGLIGAVTNILEVKSITCRYTIGIEKSLNAEVPSIRVQGHMTLLDDSEVMVDLTQGKLDHKFKDAYSRCGAWTDQFRTKFQQAKDAKQVRDAKLQPAEQK
jgi:hypothetical protein